MLNNFPFPAISDIIYNVARVCENPDKTIRPFDVGARFVSMNESSLDNATKYQLLCFLIIAGDSLFDEAETAAVKVEVEKPIESSHSRALWYAEFDDVEKEICRKIPAKVSEQPKAFIEAINCPAFPTPIRSIDIFHQTPL